MRYKISFVPGEPRFDTLGVIKLCCSDSVDINSRIYGQAQLGRCDGFFYARVWSFESSPAARSKVSVALRRGESSLFMEAGFDGSFSLSINGAAQKELLTAYLISGEDLQGEYWGAVMMLPADTLFERFGLSEQSLPAVLRGNVARENPAFSSAVPDGEEAEFLLMPRL